MRRVYVQSLAYTGSGEVLKVRKDGKLVVETPSGRTHRVDPANCRPVEFKRPGVSRLTQVRANTSRPELVAVPKPPPPVRDVDYLAWIRRQPCAVCGTTQSIEASHHPEEGHGTLSRKCSDLRTIALCTFHHASHHSNPLDRAWVEEQVEAHQARWLRERA